MTTYASDSTAAVAGTPVRLTNQSTGLTGVAEASFSFTAASYKAVKVMFTLNIPGAGNLIARPNSNLGFADGTYTTKNAGAVTSVGVAGWTLVIAGAGTVSGHFYLYPKVGTQRIIEGAFVEATAGGVTQTGTFGGAWVDSTTAISSVFITFSGGNWGAGSEIVAEGYPTD